METQRKRLELTRQMSPSDMRSRPRDVMSTNSLPSLSMRVDFRVIVVPRPGDGSVAYCVVPPVVPVWEAPIPVPVWVAPVWVVEVEVG